MTPKPAQTGDHGRPRSPGRHPETTPAGGARRPHSSDRPATTPASIQAVTGRTHQTVQD
jgi:hypothetical protein